MAAEATKEETPKEAPKKSRIKLLLIVLNVVFFLAGAGFFVMTKLGAKPPTGAATEDPQHTEDTHADADQAAPADKGHGEAKGHGKEPAKGGHGEAKGHGKEPAKGHGASASAGPQDIQLLPLTPFVVNLSGDQGQRYLRLVAQVEARGESAKAEIESRLPEIRNRLLFLLTSKTFAEIGTVQGKYDLQAEISKTINDMLEGPFVRKTLFTDFIVQ